MKGTSHEPISNELNWPSLTDRREGVKLKNFFKIMNKEMPQYLESLIPVQTGTKRPQSRNPDNFYAMRSRIETYRLSFIPSSARLYNSLDTVDRSFEYANSLMKKKAKSIVVLPWLKKQWYQTCTTRNEV